MNTSQLKTFAQNARRKLIELVSTKLSIVLDADSAARRENEKAVIELEKEISRTSRDQVIEKVAYIWFNRFCALRFMDVNRYTNIGVVSPVEGFSQPEILMEAKQGHIDESLRIDKDKVFGLLNETIPSPDPQQEAYRMLLVAVCNDYFKIMPFLFQRIADYTELLMPDDLLSDSSVLTAAREALSEEACADVEVIGWLYQFYISEKKDEVFAGLKKNKKVTPENIPAATQLFTPNWIVRYLVENSLGRLWMLNNPGSRLIDKMEYYIKPEQEETDFLVIKSPEEIKICDPACGSGHMLVYAFEILYAIYEEQGYDAPDIPKLILENNLYGIEIDERAGELAAFALCMKARGKYRRFFKKNIQPNICVLENVTFEPHEVKNYLDAVNPDLFTMGFSTLLYQFKEADNFGSLIRPELANIPDVLRLIDEKKVTDDMFLQDIHHRVLKVLKQADYLSPKYHVVIANPPYMGSNSMNGRLGKWAKDNFPDSKHDLFAMFIERNLNLLLKNGFVSMVTMQNWMFLSSFQRMRENILESLNITTLIQVGYNSFPEMNSKVAQACAFVFKNGLSNCKGLYLNLNDAPQSANKEQVFFDKLNKNDIFITAQHNFFSIPSLPIAYWISTKIQKIFRQAKKLSHIASVGKGLDTGDNNRFLRLWYEPSIKAPKWVPCQKGGPYRKWYGNNDIVIYWGDNGSELKLFPKSNLRNAHNYFKCGLTWTRVSSGIAAFRYFSEGSVFESTGPCLFPTNISKYAILGFLNSKLSFEFLKFLAPTLDFQSGHISSLPILEIDWDNTSIIKNVKQCISISKKDWDSFETSRDFKKNPLLEFEFSCKKIEDSFNKMSSFGANITKTMSQLEEDINKFFIKSYGLEDEFNEKVPLCEITITCNLNFRYGRKKEVKELNSLLLSDTIKEFISYSVGCILGRYSLDKEGLILASQGENLKNYLDIIPEPIFTPDDDNVIPIMDVDWFPDDIVERFKKFLKVTFGEEHYTENLEFIEKAIGKDIRKFFLKDFYAYHVKMYKKRPIYWMFSSPKGSFNALIYMHRYRPDTVSVVLNDYLREFRTKLTARKDNLENISISTSASQTEKTNALKEIEKIKKVLDEIDDYERDILYPLATKQIEIDLDDGVKENYPKFGNALKKIPGLS